MRNGPVGPLVSPAFHLGLLACGLVVCAVLDTTHGAGPIAMLGLGLCGMAVLRAPVLTLVHRLLPLGSCGLVAVALLLLAPADPGAPVVVLPLWGRYVPAQSAGFVLSLWVKSGLIVLWLTAFAHALSERDLLEGLMAWRLPPRVTALTYLMVRGLKAVGEDVQRLSRAREARGRPRGLYALRVAASTSQTLLLRLGRRAETQGLALAARGFRGSLELLDVRPLRFAHGLALALLTGALIWVTHLWL